MSQSERLKQVSDIETDVILSEARKVLERGVFGDMVEFGCYCGDTSLLLERILEREFKELFVEGKRLWIYDSFEGLPPRTAEDASVAGDAFSAGELFVTKREVIERFKKAGLKVPRVRKGFFENLNPETDLPEKISFAFLDGDLYCSIKTSLRLVAPRITHNENGSGVIIVHDYNNPQLPGVAKAVDEWMREVSSQAGAGGRTYAQKTAPRLQRRESLAIISW